MKDDYSSGNQPLLYKQVFSESTFTLDYIKGDCPLSIYLIHNHWIGLDEEIHLFHHQAETDSNKKNTNRGEIKLRTQTKGKVKRKQAEKQIPVELQPSQCTPSHTEDDLLQYISWDELEQEGDENNQPFSSKPISETASILQMNNKKEQHKRGHDNIENFSTELNVEEFLQSLFC